MCVSLFLSLSNSLSLSLFRTTKWAWKRLVFIVHNFLSLIIHLERKFLLKMSISRNLLLEPLVSFIPGNFQELNSAFHFGTSFLSLSLTHFKIKSSVAETALCWRPTTHFLCSAVFCFYFQVKKSNGDSRF